MRIATLPFSTSYEHNGSYSREIVSIFAQSFEQAPGVSSVRAVFTFENDGELGFVLPLSDEPGELDTILEVGQSMQADYAFDGHFTLDSDQACFLIRLTDLEQECEISRRSYQCKRDEIFSTLRAICVDSLVILGAEVDDALYEKLGDFGTQDVEAFLSYLVGRDGSAYLHMADGKTSSEFRLEETFARLLDALKRDSHFDAALEHLCALTVKSSFDQHLTLEEAVPVLQEAQRLSPSSWKPIVAKAQLHTQRQEWALAEEGWRSALKLDPMSSSLWTDLGVCLVNQGRYEDSFFALRRAILINPMEAQALEHLGLALVQMGNEREAIDCWEAALQVRPDNAITYTNLGRAYMMVGDGDNAERVFQSGLLLAEDKSTIYRNYAPFLVEQERFDEALEYFERAAAHYPYDVTFMIEYTNALGRMGRHDEVKPILEAILALNSSADDRAQASAWLTEIDHPDWFMDFRSAADDVWDGDLDRGVSALEKLSLLAPDYWKAWHLLSRGYNKQQRFSEAEDAARRVLEIFPNYEWAYGELTGALFQQKRFKDAYTELQAASRRMPGSVTVLCNLAMAAYYLKKRGEAIEYLQRARMISPQDQETARLIEMIDGEGCRTA